MLRVTRTVTRRFGHPRRWYAKKSGGKRPLVLDQTRGPTKAAAAATPVAPAAATQTDPSSSSSSSLLPIAAVLLLLGGGGAFYYYNQQQQQPPVVGVGGGTSKVGDASTATKTTTNEVEEKDASTTTSSNDSATTVSSSSEAAVVNKVTQIGMTGQMKHSNAAPVVVPGVAHPQAGHRVSMVPASVQQQQQQSLEDTSDTEAAKQLLHASTTTMDTAAAQELIHSHATLRSKLDASLFADLDTLNASQLKARIIQLSTELQDRTQWEAIRLKEFMHLKEKETTEKYLEILQKQRHELQDLMAQKLRDQERELSSQTLAALQEKEQNIQTVLNTALEAQQNEHDADKKAFEEIITGEIRSRLEETFQSELERVQSQAADHLQEKVTALQKLSEQLEQLQVALVASQTSKEGSLKAHRLSAAALALSEKLESDNAAHAELALLKQAAGHEGVIATACATIPQSVKTGIPTVAQLQHHFERILKTTRVAVLVPAGRPGLEGQLAGMVLAALKSVPDVDDTSVDEASSPELLLVKAQHHVQLGELETAVGYLEQLSGQAKYTVQDWIQEALNRVAVEKALKVIKMECALLNESCLVEEQP